MKSRLDFLRSYAAYNDTQKRICKCIARIDPLRVSDTNFDPGWLTVGFV